MNYRGRWNHWAFIKKGDLLQIYLNGILWHEGHTPKASALNDMSLTTFYLGFHPPTSAFYRGRMYGFRLYALALNAEAPIIISGPNR